jgi:hypothetical protein
MAVWNVSVKRYRKTSPEWMRLGYVFRRRKAHSQFLANCVDDYLRMQSQDN